MTGFIFKYDLNFENKIRFMLEKLKLAKTDKMVKNQNVDIRLEKVKF